MPGALAHTPALSDATTRRSALALPAAITLVLALIIGFQPMPRDPDLWFHLAGGEYMLQTAAVPQADPFSLTRQGEPWVPHSWLFDVGLALSWHTIGPRATEALFAAAFAAAILLAFNLLTRRGVAPLPAAACALALALLAANARGLRPQTLSLLACAVVVALLARQSAAPQRRLVWMLPLVFLLWAQVHAACVVGLVVAALWLAGRGIDALLANQWAQRRLELTQLTVGLCLSLLAVLITPHRMTHFAYARFTAGLSVLAHTQEWQPPRPFHWELPDVYAYLLLGGVIAALARSRRRVGWAEIGVCVATLLLALTAVRHIPLAGMAAIPLLAGALGGNPTAGRLWPLLRRNGLAVGLCSLAVVALLWNRSGRIEARYAAVEPVAGARALAQLDGEWRVFTTYNTGSYVLHAAPGRLRVFIDSRADVYGDEIFAAVHQAQLGRGWQELFRRWEINAAVLERSDPLVEILRDDPAWRLLAEDPEAVTFIRADVLPQVCISPSASRSRGLRPVL